MDRLKQLEFQFLSLPSLNIPILCNEVHVENGHFYLSVKSEETKHMRACDIAHAKLPSTLGIANHNA